MKASCSPNEVWSSNLLINRKVGLRRNRNAIFIKPDRQPLFLSNLDSNGRKGMDWWLNFDPIFDWWSKTNQISSQTTSGPSFTFPFLPRFILFYFVSFWIHLFFYIIILVIQNDGRRPNKIRIKTWKERLRKRKTIL